MRYTRREHEEWLNEVGIPDCDRKGEAGRIPDTCEHYGRWLRRNDPVAFNVSFSEREREVSPA